MRSRLGLHAGVTLACSIVHDGFHVHRGAPLDLLWLCNVAVPLIAAGCFFRSRRAIAVGLTWLGFGTPLWLFSLVTGAGLIPTSPLVHVVAPLVALDALRRVGWPPGTWPWALGGSVLLLLGTRLTGDANGNVNLMFAIQRGWEPAFHGSCARFLGAVVATSLLWAIAFDHAMARVLRTENAEAVKGNGFPSG